MSLALAMPCVSFAQLTSPVGTATATQTAIVKMTQAGTAASISVVTQGASNLDFTAVAGGTCSTTASYSVGDTCTQMYSFKPTAPGTRYGAAVLRDSNSNVLGTAYFGGQGTGPQLLYSAGKQISLINDGNNYRGPVFDAAGNLYVSGSNQILKFSPAGTKTIVDPSYGSGGVTIDGAGNLFYNGGSGLFEIPAGATTSIQVASLNSPDNTLAVDTAGNIYYSDNGNQIIVKLSAGTFAASTYLPYQANTRFIAIAFDAANNLFLADYNNSTILEQAYGATSTILIANNSKGISNPQGIAVDAAGNLYVSNSNNTLIQLRAGTYAPTTLATPLNTCCGVAVRGDGAIATSNNGNVFLLDRSQANIQDFGQIPTPTTTTDQIVSVENDGNMALTIATITASTNFAINATDTTCPTTGGTLGVAAACNVAPYFNPSTYGVFNGNLNFTDNSLNAVASTQQIPLTGKVGMTNTITFTPPASPVTAPSTAMLTATATSGGPVTFTVLSGLATVVGNTITYTGTGSVVIEADSPQLGSYLPAAPVTQTVVVTVPPTAVGATSSPQLVSVLITTAGTLNKISVGTQGLPNLDFNAASGGTCLIGHPYAVGDMCTASYTFKPTQIGQRLGAVQLFDATSVQLGIAYLSATGNGPLGELSTGTVSPFIAGDAGNNAHSLVFDAAGNCYLVMQYENQVREYDKCTGTPKLLNDANGSNWYYPSAAALDGAGNLYVSDFYGGNNYNGQTIKITSPSTGGTSSTVFVPSGHVSGITADAVGNIFLADQQDSQVLEVPAGTTTVNAVASFYYPTSVVADANSNIYATGYYGVYELAAGSNALTQLSTGSYSNTYNAGGIALDPAGHVYFNMPNNGDIVEIPAGGGQPINVFAGIAPNGNQITIDGKANIYFADSSNSGQYDVFSRANASTVAFGAQAGGTVSAPQTVTLENDGASTALSINSVSVTTPFVIDSTSTCVASSLAAGGACSLLIEYAPATTSSGNLFGMVTINDNSAGIAGTVQTVPLSASSPATFGSLPVGTSSTTQTLNVSFPTATTLNSSLATAVQVLTQGIPNLDFTLVSTTCVAGMSYAANTGCAVQVKFTPTQIGQRVGATVIYDNSATPLAVSTAYVSGTGQGPVGVFSAGAISNFLTPGQYTYPRGIVFDAAGNCFVTLQNYGQVLAYTGCTGNPTYVGNSWSGPSGIAIDGAGNLFVSEMYGDRITRVVNPLSGSNAITSTVVAGYQPQGVAVDAGGNVFFVDSNTQSLLKVQAGGNVAQQIVTGLSNPVGVAIDGSGNVFLAEGSGTPLLEVLAGTHVANPISTGSYTPSQPAGIAVDTAGHIYFSDTQSGDIVELPAGGGNPINITSGVATIGQYLALDTKDNLYFTDVSNASIDIMARSVGPNIIFPTTAFGSTSPVITTSYENDGNTNLILTSEVVSAPFSLVAASTTCVNGALGSGATCAIGLQYTPTAQIYGTVTGTATVTDNSQNIAGSKQTATLLSLTPLTFPATAVGASSTPVSVTFSFTAATTLNSTAATAIQVLTQGTPNLDFKVASGGTCAAGASYTAGQSCTVNVTFKPLFPGRRLGGVALFDNSATPVAVQTYYVAGVGNASLGVFYPGTQTAVFSGFCGAFQLGTDAGGNVYVDDYNCNSISKFAPVSGGYNQTHVGTGAAQMAIDGLGNVYIADLFGSSIRKETYANGSYTDSVLYNQMYGVYGLAVDRSGNLFIASSNNAAIYKATLAGGAYTLSTIATGHYSYLALALDAVGNLYVASNDSVYKETLSGGTYTESTLLTGLSNANGIAVDAAGAVYVANSGYGQLLKLIPNTTSPTGYQTATLPYSGGMNGVAVDQAGNIYVSDGGGTVYKIDVADTPTLTFPQTTQGSTAGPLTTTLTNIGNQPLSVTAAAFAPVGSGFVYDSANSCTSNLSILSIAPSAACPLSFDYAPNAEGTAAATFTLTDNSNGATAQAIKLLGFSPVTDTQVVAAGPVVAIAGQNLTVSGTIAGASGATDINSTAAITLSVAGPVGYTAPAPQTVNAVNGVASANFGPSIPGSYTVTASATGLTTGTANFTLLPSVQVIVPTTTAVAATSATQTATVTIYASGTLGSIAVTTQGISGLDYVAATGGTCAVGTAYSAGQTCTVKYTFNPKSPGLRSGGITLSSNDSTPVSLGYTVLSGVGTAPQVVYPANTATKAILGGIYPTQIVTDAAGNVYYSDYYNYTVSKIVAVNGQIPASPTVITLLSNYYYCQGIAVDGAGNVFASSGYFGSVTEIPFNGTTYGSPYTLIQNLNSPGQLTFDRSGNLYVSELGQSDVVKLSGIYGNFPVSPTTTTIATHGNYPQQSAVDASGNVYVTGPFGVYKYVQNSDGTYADGNAGILIDGTQGYGLSFDAAGNLYNSSFYAGNIREIVAVNGTIPASPAIITLGSGFASPRGIAIEANGNFYVADYGSNQIVELNLGTTPALSFADTGVGAASGTQTVQLENIGNANLVLTALANASTNFSLDASTTCTGTSVLAESNSCNLGEVFTPQTVGTFSSTLKITDNNLNVSGTVQSIVVGGNGVQGTPSVTVTASSISYGTATTTLSAAIGWGGTADTGAVSFKIGSGASVAGTCTATSTGETCTASYSTATIAAGSSTITVLIASDTNYLSSSNTAALTVSKTTPTISVPTQSVGYGTNSVTLSASLSYTGSGSAPSGAFTFKVDTGTAIAATCTGSSSPLTCTATYNPSALSPGNHTVTAAIAATTNYNLSSNTGTLTVTQTTPTITVATQSVAYGTSSVTLSASLAFTGSGSAPSGAFTFKVDTGTAIAATCTGSTSPLTCTATYNPSALAPGNHTVTAADAADTNYALSSNTGTLTITQTTPTITVATQSVPYGTSSVTLSASLAYTGSGSAPSGAFTFKVDTGTAFAATCTGSTSPLTCTATYNPSTLTGGNHTVTATDASDTNYTLSSNTGTLTISKTTPVVSVSTQVVAYGSSSVTLSASLAYTGSGAAPSGAFTFSVDGGTAIAATCSGSASPLTCTATYNPSALGAGGHTVTATDAADTNYNLSSNTGTLTVNQPPTQVAVSAAPTVKAGAALGVATAMIESNTGATVANSTAAVTFTLTGPTGFTTVTSTSNASAGVATYNFSSILTIPGSYTLSASSAGLTTGVQTVTVTPPFLVTVPTSPLILTGPAGNVLVTNLTITPNGLSSGTISFDCTGLPNYAKCLFLTSTITFTAGSTTPQTVQLTVTTSIATVASLEHSSKMSSMLASIFWLPGLLLAGIGVRSRKLRTSRALLLLAILFCGALGLGALTGCGTTSPTPATVAPGTYNFQIVATSGSYSQTIPVTMILQ